MGWVGSWPKHYVPLFNTDAQSDELVLMAEEWCFGYMRGVDLGDWPILPEEMDTWLNAIALHGREDNFKVLDTLSHEEHQQSVMQVGSAVLKLHQYFLAQRTPPPSERPAVVRTEAKVGRNDPCPCGSGKKFKQVLPALTGYGQDVRAGESFGFVRITVDSQDAG